MKPHIGIPDKTLKALAGILDKLLADEYVLYTKTRNAHWNVTGTDFHAMHLFFETQYHQLEERLDEVAERSRSLGLVAMGSMSEMLKTTRLKEEPGRKHDSRTFIADLLADHESIIRSLRDDVTKTADLEDDGTSDFLTGLMEEHEKMAWMLRSSLS